MLSAKTIRRWLPLLLLTMLAFGAWQTAERTDTDDVSDQRLVYEEALGSPLLSARRIPETLQAPVARDALAPSLQTVLDNSTPDTCLLVLVDGRILGAQNEDIPMVPASNQKLPTTFAALQTFGGEATFVTTVTADGDIVDGVINGNLYLIGGGDPFLGTDEWWNQYDDQNGRAHTRLEDLADSIVAQGLSEVTGALVGDESYFDTVRTGQWAQRLIDSNQSGPLSALAVNEGFEQWPATYEGSSRPRVPTDNPPLQAAQVLARLLTERGVTIGSTEAGPARQGAVPIAEIASPPLADIITHVNSYSSNFGAELLVKHLGLEVNGEGSTQAGTAAITAFLRNQGLPMAGVSVVDGSGLAETNTLTCSLLAAILDSAGPTSVFAQSLSIGGERGSLIRRHVDTPAEGMVFAKTGTLNGVTALSGFAFSSVDPATALVFAYMVNGELAGQDEGIRGLQEPFIEDLVLYPQAPAISALSPLPTKPFTEPIPEEGSD